ncbi:MAG: hypothetical protein WD825_17125 [Gemmatimonadaceae bacterium]
MKAPQWRERKHLMVHQAAVFYARRIGCNLLVTVTKDGWVIGIVEREVPHAGGCTHDRETFDWPITPEKLQVTIAFAKGWCERTALKVASRRRS